MKKHLFLLIAAISAFSNCFGQVKKKLSSTEFKQEIQQAVNQMNQENIVLKFKKETFQDLKSGVPVESVHGVIYKESGVVYKMNAGGITILQTKEYAIYIDSVERFVQVSDIDPSMKAMSMANELTQEMLDRYELEKTSFGGYIILKAVPKVSDEGTMEFYIDAKKKALYKLVITLPPANYFMESEDDETIESPYITVVYEPITPLKNNEVSFSDEKILVKDKQNNLSLAPGMVSYQLHDARLKSKK